MSDNLNIVYLYGYSPNDTIHLDTLTSLIKKQSIKNLKIGIILIHDGVIAASSSKKLDNRLIELLELPIELYMMTPDIKARGIRLDSVRTNIKPIEYNELVDILDSAEKIISWM